MAINSSFAYISSLLFNSRRSYAVYSALALILVQVTIGITMKLAQQDGDYAFSPSGSVTISEFLKMLISYICFQRDRKYRIHPRQRTSPALDSEVANKVDENLLSRHSHERLSIEEMDYLEAEAHNDVRHGGPPIKSLRNQVSGHIALGLYGLALCYVLVNNLIFVGYRLADPATIQLTRSGVTCITALVMRVMLNTKLSGLQWLSLTMQVCGLYVTQYDPSSTAAVQLPTPVYLLLFFQVLMSAVAGVFNQTLLQAEESSIHAVNVHLYGAGTCINLLCHIILWTTKPGEPSLFHGYNSFGAIMIIVSNVFIGLAINAVYKYADAVIKCLATAIGTAILISISPILFDSSFSFLIVPGSIIIFISSWLYIHLANPMSSPGSSGPSLHSKLDHLKQQWQSHRKRCIVLFVLALLVTSEIVHFTMTSSFEQQPIKSKPEPKLESPKTVQSPFKDSMAFIRWNSPHKERVPYLLKYKPFFDTVHLSIPDDQAPDKDQTSLTNDSATYVLTVYRQVSNTMQAILDDANSSHINGMLFFHFDAWIDPLAWADMNLNNIYYPFMTDPVKRDVHSSINCMSDISQIDWWAWKDNVHKQAMQAAASVKKASSDYVIDDKEWCIGWSDIYFVPRRFFADYIYLSKAFYDRKDGIGEELGVFHEVAVPTILHIIDRSRRTNPYIPVLSNLVDCWGHCCAENPTRNDVLAYRCGHRLDYRNTTIVDAFFGKIEKERKLLGRAIL